MELDDSIGERKSVRNFSRKLPNWKDIVETINTCRFSPMSGNNYSLRFLLTKDKEKIEKISQACQQDFIRNAPFVLVVLNDPSRTRDLFGERAERYLKQQAGGAIQTFLLKIQDYGLSSCWVGHFVDSLIKEIFKIPQEMEIEAILPIGYESKEKTPYRRKIELDRILFFEKYGERRMKDPSIVDG